MCSTYNRLSAVNKQQKTCHPFLDSLAPVCPHCDCLTLPPTPKTRDLHKAGGGGRGDSLRSWAWRSSGSPGEAASSSGSCTPSKAKGLGTGSGKRAPSETGKKEKNVAKPGGVEDTGKVERI